MTRLPLPWPPSVNHYWRHARGRHYIGEEGKRYRELVAWTARAHGVPRREGPVAVVLRCYPPDRRIRDLDNLPKALIDALTHGGAWTDDSQISVLIVSREPFVVNGRVDVTICAPAEAVRAYAEG